MIYQTVSMQEVIARVVRNTGVQDSKFILPLDEWIPEAMGIMNLRQAVEKTYEDIEVHFHKAKMPCDLHSIEAVEWNGQNLLPSNSKRVVGAATRSFGNKQVIQTTDVFKSVPTTYQVKHTTSSPGTIFDGTAVPYFCSQSSANCGTLKPCRDSWYQVEVPGYITTSFKKGWIRVHYKCVPTDEEGLPMIPDNENFKQALYWYCRGMMIGLGWDDPVYKNNIEALLGEKGKFETSAGRAVAEITYPTDGELELAVRNSNRLIKDEGYFNRFFETAEVSHSSHLAETEYSDAARVIPNMPVIPNDTSSGATRTNETPSGLINGSNKVFHTQFTYIIGTLAVFRNGVLQAPGLHYSFDGINTFTFVVAPLNTPSLDVLLVNYIIA
jgi:hypothetical protein